LPDCNSASIPDLPDSNLTLMPQQETISPSIDAAASNKNGDVGSVVAVCQYAGIAAKP
jgi:hypothetical protein